MQPESVGKPLKEEKAFICSAVLDIIEATSNDCKAKTLLESG